MNPGLIALTAIAGVAAILLARYALRRFQRRAVDAARTRVDAFDLPPACLDGCNAVDYSGDAFFSADGADARIVRRRSEALDTPGRLVQAAHAKSAEWGASVREGFSDIRFADANRVPFPFARMMRDQFDLTTVVTASDGPRLRDLDGRWSLDVSGSYGVNVAGFDRYKEWIEQGWNRVKALGPVLGPVHPIVADNIRMLRASLGAGRCVVSHERHRSGDGRRASGEIQHRPEADRLLLRRVPRMVGRRRRRPRQRARTRRLPHAQGSRSGIARSHQEACARNRRRAREPGAVLPSRTLPRPTTPCCSRATCARQTDSRDRYSRVADAAARWCAAPSAFR